MTTHSLTSGTSAHGWEPGARTQILKARNPRGGGSHRLSDDNQSRAPRRFEPIHAERPKGKELWGFLALLAVSAIFLCANLSVNGYANSFYTAAIQSGAKNWEAFFFGSTDWSNSITVDKTPLSLWPSMLSVKIFGLNSWSVLVPYALIGVATIGLLWSTVRRYAGNMAAYVAAAALLFTPVATMMFRFDNPDAMLIFLLTAAVWAGLRCVENGRWRWAALVGVFIGLGFLAKQLQAFLVIPPLVVMFLVASPRNWKVKIGQLLTALGTTILSAGWYLAIVELWPASSRPYIGGSQNNSIIELTLGYNGFGRLNGNETGSVIAGGTGSAGMWGSTGIGRMFEAEQGGQIAWLIPAALVFLCIGIALRGRAPLTDTLRASYIVWGGWLLTTGLTFSFMQGIFHAYYTVALSPAIAALVGLGAADAWKHRSTTWVRILTALTVFGTGLWSYELLSRSSTFVPWLKWVILAVTFASALAWSLLPTFENKGKRGLATSLVTGAMGLGILAGPASYSIYTLTEAHTGSIVTAGPQVAGGMGGPGGHGGPGGMGQGGMGGPVGTAGMGTTGQNGTSTTTGQTQGNQTGQPPQMPGQATTNSTTGTTQGTTNSATNTTNTNSTTNTANGQTGTQPAQGGQAGPGGQGGNHGPGGMLGGTSVSSEMKQLLETNSSKYSWTAAVVGSQEAASYQLATNTPVMAMGGFNGTDPSPTLAHFKQWVAEGKIHYLIASSGMNTSESTQVSEILTWVKQHYTAKTVGGTTVYDLTSATSSS